MLLKNEPLQNLNRNIQQLLKNKEIITRDFCWKIKYIKNNYRKNVLLHNSATSQIAPLRFSSITSEYPPLCHTRILTYGVPSVKASRVRGRCRNLSGVHREEESVHAYGKAVPGAQRKTKSAFRGGDARTMRGIGLRVGEVKVTTSRVTVVGGGGGGGLTTCQDWQEQQQGHAPRIAHLSGTLFGLTTVSDGEVGDWRAL